MIELATNRYEITPRWEQAPPGYRHLDVPDVAIGPGNLVYILTRRESRIMVYEPSGKFVRAFAEGQLSSTPHGIAVGNDGTVYCADSPAHVVRIFGRSGQQVSV